MLIYSQWLRTSNETADLRAAFALSDQMPDSIGLDARVAIIDAIAREADRRWSKTKKLNEVESDG